MVNATFFISTWQPMRKVHINFEIWIALEQKKIADVVSYIGYLIEHWLTELFVTVTGYPSQLQPQPNGHLGKELVLLNLNYLQLHETC